MINTATVTQLNPSTKRCYKCEETKATTDFGKDSSRADGLNPLCKPCNKTKHTKFRAENREAVRASYAKWYAKPENKAKVHYKTAKHNQERADLLIDRFKSAPCFDCKQSFPTCCMDFDHRPGVDKVFELNYRAMKSFSLDSIIEEIAKCDLVCSNCHRIRTKTRNQVGRRSY
jgi:hypothetical protein